MQDFQTLSCDRQDNIKIKGGQGNKNVSEMFLLSQFDVKIV